MPPDEKEGPIWVFVWRGRRSSNTDGEELLACGRLYAAAAGIRLPAGEAAPLIARREKGKPYFPAWPEVHFSLSHSGDFTACAYAGRPVGLDLQVHRYCRQAKIAQRYFHPEETAYLAASGYVDFYDLWTAKESYGKYTGDGIAGILGEISLAAGDDLKASLPDAVLRRPPFRPGYSMCLCARRVTDVRLIYRGDAVN
jgi:4'-phosphopantetheinyl transferase